MLEEIWSYGTLVYVWIKLILLVLVVVILAVGPLSVLFGQMRRKELLSLTHIHISLLGFILLNAGVCVFRISELPPARPHFAHLVSVCLYPSLVLVILPYLSLMAFRLYQGMHRYQLHIATGQWPWARKHWWRDVTIGTGTLILLLCIVSAPMFVMRMMLSSSGPAGYDKICAKALLKWGINANISLGGCYTPLFFACRDNDVEMARLLIQGGADVNYCASLLLAVASPHKDLTVFKLLIERGADVTANDMHRSALARVAQEGNAEAVRLLLARGADVNYKNVTGDTPLMMACVSGHSEVARALLNGGAEVNATSSILGSALMCACAGKGPDRVQLAKMLLEKGADVNARQKSTGNTPITAAASFCQLEIARMLLKAGADLEARNNERRTALDLASAGLHCQNKELVRFLQDLHERK